jgi:hypothetical protein
MGKVIRLVPKKVNLKDLIPVWVYHNNKFFSVPNYLIHKNTGEVYSLKRAIAKENLLQLTPFVDSGKNCYPRICISDQILFKDLSNKVKHLFLHRTLVISNIFHFNRLAEFLHKAYPHIPLKVFKNTPREILELTLIGLEVNHIDHNKLNHQFSNLELVSSQDNSKKYEKHRKKVARKRKKI